MISITKEPEKCNLRITCYGFGCSKPAIVTIKENVGQLGEITLNLCSTCVMKFRRNNKERGEDGL